MNLNSFDLNLLVAFEALMTEGQVTRAARRLHLTQPAMSSALARLRAAFDDPLFIQDGKAMRPTMRARELEAPIRSALAQLRQVLDEPEFCPETSFMTVRIGTSDDIEVVLLTHVLDRIRASAPNVRLVVRRVRGLFELPTEELSIGTLDFAIGPFARGAHSSAGITFAPLYTDGFACIARKGHPQVKRSLSAAQFLELPHVVVYYPAHGTGIVDRLLAERGQQRKIAMEVPHVNTALHTVAQSDLIATLTAAFVRRVGEAAGVRIFKLPFPARALEIGLHWHARHNTDPAHAWMRQVIIDAAARVR